MPTELTGDLMCSEFEALCEQTRRFPGPVTLNLYTTLATSLAHSTRPQSPAQMLILTQEPIQIQMNFQNLTLLLTHTTFLGSGNACRCQTAIKLAAYSAS